MFTLHVLVTALRKMLFSLRAGFLRWTSECFELSAEERLSVTLSMKRKQMAPIHRKTALLIASLLTQEGETGVCEKSSVLTKHTTLSSLIIY